jgi:hypothetical protein
MVDTYVSEVGSGRSCPPPLGRRLYSEPPTIMPGCHCSLVSHSVSISWWYLVRTPMHSTVLPLYVQQYTVYCWQGEGLVPRTAQVQWHGMTGHCCTVLCWLSAATATGEPVYCKLLQQCEVSSTQCRRHGSKPCCQWRGSTTKLVSGRGTGRRCRRGLLCHLQNGHPLCKRSHFQSRCTLTRALTTPPHSAHQRRRP